MLKDHKGIKICRKCYNLCNVCNCNEGFIDVDKGMLFIVQTFNLKGYHTIGCCEGHEVEELYEETGKRIFDGYIAFEKDYDFNIPIPKIFQTRFGTDRLKDCLFIQAKDISKEEFLKTLTDWALALDNLEVE